MLELNWKSLTDQQIVVVLSSARAEQYRRQTIAGAVNAVPEIRGALLAAEGQESGGPFVPPTGAHNAYPKDWIVTHDGKEWEATREGAHGVPGESGDWRQVAEEGEILEWVAPTGAHNAYDPGSLVVHNGHVWRNDHTSPNGWEPGTTGSQWTDLGPVEDYEEEA